VRNVRSKPFEKFYPAHAEKLGSFGYDAWGFHPDPYMTGIQLFKPFYDFYFRVQINGLEQVPAHGRALVVGNHGGQIP